MLGEDGKGFDIMMGTVLPMFNVLNAACSVGLMEAAVQRTAQHASGIRYAHLDSTLADLPTIRNYIARMRVKTDCARTLLDDTIQALESGRPRHHAPGAFVQGGRRRSRHRGRRNRDAGVRRRGVSKGSRGRALFP